MMSQRREEEEDNDARAVWLCFVVRWRGGDSCTKLVLRLHFGLTEFEHFEKWPSFSRLLIYFLPGETCRGPKRFFLPAPTQRAAAACSILAHCSASPVSYSKVPM